jgi:thiol-disulfide isomerase/thioredoxin
MTKIIMFYGESCSHCHSMMPIINRLIKEGFEIEKKEVWNNDKNAQEMRKFTNIIVPACGDGLGVPCFVNEKTNTALCGEQSYETLRKWMSQ